MRFLFALAVASAAFAQTPPLRGVGSDAVTATSVRIYWTTDLYHDTATDTTLTTGFTAPTICGLRLLAVGSTSGWTGSSAGSTPAGIPSTFIMGAEMGKVVQVVDGTHAYVYLTCDGQGYNSDFTESAYNAVNGFSISVTGSTATATLPYTAPSWYATGKNLRLAYCFTASLCPSGGVFGFYTIATRTDVGNTTLITFPVSGVTAGTYDATTDADMELRPYGNDHTGGETISLLGADSMVCYGATTAYGKSEGWRENGTYEGSYVDAHITQHYVYLTDGVAGTTMHYKVLSTPRQFGTSSCTSPGTHTAQSSDQTVTFASSDSATPVAPSGVSFSTALPGSYADSVTTAGDCSDLCTLLATKRGVAGNHEIKIPEGSVCTKSCTLPPQTNGSLVTTIRSSAADGSLPAPGACLPPVDSTAASTCIDAAAYTSHLATIYNAGGDTPTPIFKIQDLVAVSGIHLGPGLKLQAHPNFAPTSNFRLVDLSHSQGFGSRAHAMHGSGIILDRVWLYQAGVQNGSYNAVYVGGMNSFALVDSVIWGTTGRGNDHAGVQVEMQDSSDGGTIIQNNRMTAQSMVIYLGDNGWNTSDGIIKRNWLHVPPEWRSNNPTYARQVQIPVTSITRGNPTTITLSKEADWAQYAMSFTAFSLEGATGGGTALNATNYSLLAGTLDDFNCDGSNCIAATHSAHGLATNDRVWIAGLTTDTFGCVNEVGVHQITVTDSTHVRYASSRVAHCLYSNVTMRAPVFIVTPSSSTVGTIPIDSSGFATITGTIVAYYGLDVDAKNCMECKTCQRWEISGNLSEGCFAGNQEGQFWTLTNRIGGTYQDHGNRASQGTISDINIHDNFMRGGCMVLDHLGIQDNGSSIPMNRITLKNNLAIDVTNEYSDGRGCPGITVNPSLPTKNAVFDHNTFMTPSGVLLENGLTPPAIGNWTFTNNAFLYGAQAFNGGSDIAGNGHLGAQIWQTSGTGAQPNPPFPGLVWGRNVLMGDACLMVGLGCPSPSADNWSFGKQWYDGFSAGTLADYKTNYWPAHLSGIGLAGATAITAASNTTPIVLTTAALPCVPAPGDRVWVNGVLGCTAANFYWYVKAATSTSITLNASIGNGTYTSGGVVIPLSGVCSTPDNWAMASTSPYKACAGGGDTCYAAPADATAAGSGPASDGIAVGANIVALKNAIGGGGPCSDLSFSPTSASAIAGGATGTFDATVTDGTCNRGVTASAGWLTCSANCSGTGSVTGIGWAAAANTAPARSATLSAAGVTITINQASGCAFSIAPTSHAYAAAGAGQAVTITASDSSCPWTATYPDGWLSGPTSGAGSGSITVTAAVNVGALRTSTPTIAGQAYAATQSAPAPPGTSVTSSSGLGGGGLLR